MLMKSFLLKLFGALLPLFGVTALSSCDKGILGGMVCEYGTPTMDYTVMGKVVNVQNEPLKGIKVKPLHDSWPRDSTYTDTQGNFTVRRERSWLESNYGIYYAPLTVEDTSGIYRNDTVRVKMVRIKEADGWYKGAFEARDEKIIMKK